MILAIDTSHGASVALVGDGVLRRAASPDPRTHAEQLAVLLSEVLTGAPPPTAVVVGTGPAPFTGLRVGLVSAEAFAFARGLPIMGVSSLDAVALAAFEQDPGNPTPVTVVTDARRREVFAASYLQDGAGVRRLGDFYVGPPAALTIPEGSRLVGAACQLYPELLPGALLEPDPVLLARLGTLRAASGVEQPTAPLYLRRPDVKVPAGLRRAGE